MTRRRPPPASRPAPAWRRALLLALLALPTAADGHGAPVELAFWGHFPLPVARCQRAIGRAAAVCGLRVWRIRRDCALAPLRASACDPTTADAVVAAARVAALDDVSTACPSAALTTLQFLDLRDAQGDVIRFCRELEAVTASLLLDPLASTPTRHAACAARVAWASTRLLASAFRSRQRALDRIASSPLTARAKAAVVSESSAAIARATAALAASVTAGCPDGGVRGLFLRDATDLLSSVGLRADCLAGAAYAQGAIVCPPSVCGNGIPEGGEDCDDGNTRDGDTCSAGCRRTVATSGSPS